MNYINLLKKLVSINSIYPNEKELGQWVEKYLRETGWRVERQFVSKNRFNLLASKGTGSKAIMFYGHLDTVPVVKENWQTNLFELIEKKGRLYGLGAYDMKGGLTALLKATEKTDSYVKLLLTVDEENISEGAWKATEEKRSFFKDVRLVISAEPSFENGLNSVTRGRTGRVIFEVNFKGKAKHIAEYKNAVDAVKLATDFTSSLYSQRDNLFKSQDLVIQVRKIQGESVGMSVCDQVNLEIEVLLGLEDEIELVRKKLQSLATKAKVKLKKRKTPYLESYYFQSFPYQEKIGQIIKRVTNKQMSLVTRKSVGDDNVLASLNIPVITWGPEGGNAHAANEYVTIDSLEKLTVMYQKLLKRF